MEDLDERTVPTPIGRTLAAIAAATTVCVLPAFLLGSQGVQLRRDLDFDAFALGFAVALSWTAASLTSAAMGRLSERLGGGRALRLAALTSAVSQLAIAVLARSWALLALGAVVSGVANALAQPGANLLITRVVRTDRHGLAFAVKQSAIPFATLLGGMAVPLLTLTVGWRWTFAAGGLLALGAALAVPVEREGPMSRRGGAPHVEAPPLRSRLGALVILALGVGLGASAAGGLAAFLTSGAVAAGLAEGRAGWLLAAGSAIGIMARLTMGARADRRPGDQLRVVATMMALGAVAFVVLAMQRDLTYLIGTPLAFGAGWSWPGLFNLSVVRDYPEAPGAATGITQTGTYLGAALGPLAFGVITDTGPFASAWLLGAACLVLGSLAMLAGARLLARDRVGRHGSPA